MTDNEMTENEANETEEKPVKKVRKPRSDKGQKKPAKKPAKQEAAEEKATKQPRGKKLPNFVRQDGKVVILSGGDVYCRKLTPAQQAEWGVKSVSGPLGSPCKDAELVLTFKSPKAAEKFFEHSFGVEEEDEEIIVAGPKTDWESEGLSGFLD